MTFDLDPCLVRAGTGELLARGFVSEQDVDSVLVEASQYAGGWLERGDPAVVEVMSPDRGACTYDAVVESSSTHQIRLVGLRLRHRVQQRAAVRAETTLPVRVLHLVRDGIQAPLGAPLDIVVVDVSATGLRFRCPVTIPAGTRLVVVLEATRKPLHLVLEVLRQDVAPSDLSHGCRFVDLSERGADELYRFVLEEQRRRLAHRADARTR